MISPAIRSFFKRLFVRKSLADLQQQSKESDLARSLTALDLVMIGIGGIIGTGIFVLTGQAAYQFAGPAIVVSFVVSGLAASTAALSYAELSSMIPIAGSAYTYAYATMGEFVAWIIGWDLILEYMVGAAAVSVGWSGYVVAFFEHVTGVPAMKALTSAPFEFNPKEQAFHMVEGGGINLPAVIVCLGVTAMLVFGVKNSARLNAVIVAIKVFVVLLFIGVCAFNVDPSNWTPFFPPNEGTFSRFGVTGMLTGATTVFFAYIGFDAVSTTAQEAKNPQRDLPIGILGSLTICTILYIAVSLMLTGVVKYTELGGPRPLSQAVEATGLIWLSIVVEVGAIAGLTSVMMIMLMGQPRIFFAMANDGLFPRVAMKVHPKFKTPWVTTLISGFACAVLGGLLPIDVLGEMTSIGTLFAFFIVNTGVIILRKTQPDAPRRFKVPLGPYVIPGLGAALSLLLMGTATPATIIRLFAWMALGIVVYFLYGKRNSRLNHPEKWIEYDEKQKLHQSNEATWAGWVFQEP